MKFIPLLTLVCLLSTSILAQNLEGTMEKRTLTHDDHERTYLVYTPANYNKDQSHTLLLALHPASTTGQQMADMTQFQSLADENSVLMVFPDSVGGRWNASGSTEPDDIGFLTALLDTVEADYAIDESQIFGLGYSSGGLMTMKLRCVLGDRFRGIISYAAPMTFEMANDCLSSDPVSVMTIHGTSDEVFPYSGQVSVSDGTLSGTFSADQTIGFLASLNGCDSQAQIHDGSPENAQYRVFIRSYSCDHHIAELLTVTNLGHFSWAGSFPIIQNDETMTINQAIFNFIQRAGGAS